MAPALGEPREQVVDISQLPASVARGDSQIFLDAERREDFAFLRNPANAAKRTAMRRLSRDVAAAPENAAAPNTRIAHDGQEQRRFADAISAEDGEAAMLRQRERYAIEHHRGAIARTHVIKRKQRLSHDASALRSPAFCR